MPGPPGGPRLYCRWAVINPGTVYTVYIPNLNLSDTQHDQTGFFGSAKREIKQVA